MMRKMLKILLLGGLMIFLLAPQRILADGIMKVTETNAFLALMKSETVIDIFEQVAITTVEHTFFNEKTDDSLAVKYMFPLPENASVIQFGIYLEDSTFIEFKMTVSDTSDGGHSDVSEEDEALANYLLPNPFVIPLKINFGLLRTRLKYVELLPYDFGHIKLEYPLYTAQFLRGPIEIVNILINLSSQRTITDLSSSSHSITVNKTSNYSAIASYSEGSTTPDRNFKFEFNLSQEDIGLFIFCYRDPADTTETDGYFIILLEPGQNITPGDILQKYFNFIMDRSGSMSGIKIEQAKEAAVYCVQHLNEKDLFNIIDFNTAYATFSVEPVKATTNNIQSAVNYIDNIYASNSTNLYDPLMFALQQSLGEGTANQIVLLTDGRHNSGSVTNLNQVLDNVTAANTQDVNIYVFGLGNDVDKGFLQSLANCNHGLATFVSEEQSINDIISNFFLKINNPMLINISIDYGSSGANDIYPREFQDFFVGTQLVVTGRYSNFGETNVTVTGSVATADTSIIYPNIYFPDIATDYPFVPKIWAKRKIEYLYQQWLVLGEPDSLKQQIIALSIKYGVLSPFTQYKQPNPYTDVEESEMIALSANWQFDENASTIKLVWNIINLTGEQLTYDIYRSISKNGNFIKLNSKPLENMEYTDRNVNPRQTYFYKIIAISAFGETHESNTIKVSSQIVHDFVLFQNYPNPFNNSTFINYIMAQNSHVEIMIFDITGRFIRTLVSEEQVAGYKSIQWNGKDSFGNPVTTGIYLCQLKTPNYTEIKKMLLLQ